MEKVIWDKVLWEKVICGRDTLGNITRGQQENLHFLSERGERLCVKWLGNGTLGKK